MEVARSILALDFSARPVIRTEVSQVLLGGLVCEVLAVVVSLDILENVFHLLGLPLPFVLAHLCLATKKLLIWLPVAATHAVPQGSKLTIVVIEIEVVHGMAGGAVDDRGVGNVFAVVNHNSPDVDEAK